MTTSESKIFIKSNRNDCPETETKVKLCKSYFYVISFQSLSQFWVYFLILTIWMDFSWYGFVMHAMVHFVKKNKSESIWNKRKEIKKKLRLAIRVYIGALLCNHCCQCPVACSVAVTAWTGQLSFSKYRAEQLRLWHRQPGPLILWEWETVTVQSTVALPLTLPVTPHSRIVFF